MIKKNFPVLVILIFCLVSVSCVPEAVVKKKNPIIQKLKTRAQLPNEIPYKVKFIRTIGKVGTGVGEFFQPTAVDVDYDNNVYVLDSGTERVQIFDKDGKLIHEFDISNENKQQKAELTDIVVDKSYRVFVSDRQNNNVAVYEIVGKMSKESGMRAVNYSGDLESKGGEKTLEEVDTGTLFTFASGNPSGFYELKEKGFDSITFEEVNDFTRVERPLTQCATIQVYVKVRFDHPMGLATDRIGNIFVVDSYSDSIKKFNYFNEYEFSFGTFGRGVNQFSNPCSVAVDYEQNIYVADTGNNRIQVFDFNGNQIAEWGGKGTGDGEFNKPVSIDLDKFGNAYVADIENNRIQVFDINGQFLFDFRGKYTDTEEGFQPLSFAISDENEMYVLDSLNNVLSMFEIIYKE